MGSDDDPSGKSKIGATANRTRTLMGYFALGLCVGIIVSELYYLKQSRATVTVPRSLASFASSASSRSQEQLATTATAAPRSDLEALLMRIAPQKEVLLAVSNKNILWDNMLGTFGDGIKRAGVKNHLIVALDDETVKFCTDHGLNAWKLEQRVHSVQQGTGDNHAVSAMKFGIISQFLELGWSVLLSDVDIAILQNPFEHLYRDSDIEGMTDGFTDPWAYGTIDGFDDPSMGWGRYAQFYKHFNMNSGFFYARATNRTLDMMVRLETRLSKEKYWDQTAYNEAMFFLSHDDYKSPQVSVRVMNIYKFMNSKVLFKDVRHRPKGQQPGLPVIVHVNYHPDKHERMKAVIKYYVDKDEHALDSFPGGSEPGSR